MPHRTLASQMMKTFQREVIQKRVLYLKGAARKQTQAQTTVASTMTIVNNRERKNRMAVRKNGLRNGESGVARLSLADQAAGGLEAGCLRKAVTIAARSGKTWVPGGRPPVAWVFSPLPVRTR